MRKWILFLVASSFIAQTHATPSFLGLCHPEWNCNQTLQTLSGYRIKTGWLENTFGSRCKCADRLLQDAREKILRVHLVNSPCMRNNRCGRYELLYDETARSASKKIIRGNRRILQKFRRTVLRLKRRIERAKGNVKLYVSPCLECDLNGRARRSLLSIVAGIMPSAILVDNPYRQRCIRGVVCEKHGINPKLSAPCIVDLDGVDGGVVDIKSWLQRYSHCELQYYWNYEMNCIRGSFIDPRKRQCRYGSDYFDNLRRTLCQYYSDLSSGICSPL